MSIHDAGTRPDTAADVGWLVVHATTPGGPVTVATRLLGDRTTAEQTAAAMQANSDGYGHYLVVHAIAEDDVWECPGDYDTIAALHGVVRPPSLHPGADDVTGRFDRAAIDAFVGAHRQPEPRYTPEDMGVFASFLPADGPGGGDAA
jgi:hypothetical protein